MKNRLNSRETRPLSLGTRLVRAGRARVYEAAGVSLFVAFAAVWFVACSQGDETNRPRGVEVPAGEGGEAGAAGAAGNGGSTAEGGSTGAGAVCVEGSKKECSITIGENNGVITCYHGVKVCKDGVWSACGDGVTSLIPKVDHPIEKPGGPAGFLTDCVNNPCDPSCQMFDETPDGGLTPNSQTPIFSWETGDLGNYPPGLAKKGLNEPCSTGYDCQFNEYCSAPISGTCEHSKCAAGDPLTNGCDTCVNSICAIDQSCCKTTYGGTCDHDYCDQGIPLAAGCDTCVDAICAADSTCCSRDWGSCSHDFCVTGTSLSNGCDSCVSSVCADDPKCCGLNTQGTCSHDYCATGAALNNGCHSCVNDICAVDPDCCKTHTTGSCAHDYCATGTTLNQNCHSCATEVCAKDPKCCGLNTTGTCSHDYCATGAALAPGCQSCVDQICATDPLCCARPIGTCSHDFCATGAALTNGCDPKVSTICAQDPKCCGINTQGTCSHDYCATGAALQTGCFPCVTSVCAANPKCCDSTPGTVACGHDYCATGTKLDPNCDPCVAAVCAAQPSCCSAGGQAWNSTCVNLVATKCAVNDRCPSPKWDATCTAAVGTVCGNSCAGTWDAKCVAKATPLSGDNCATHTWGNSCVNKVTTTCGNTCTSSWGATCVAKATQCAAANGCNTWDASCVAKVGTVCGNTCTSSWGTTCTDKAGTMCGNECQPHVWDQDCVNKVGSVCGKSCGPFEWDQNCVDMVDTVCAAQCYEDPGCLHDKCDSGGPLSANCDSCVASICQELPFCCTTGWTDLCVDRVKTKCNLGCPTKGDCVPWLPGQTDPDCAGYDLAVGIPCGTTIPVCNHGKTTVPAGVRVVHFPANSNQYPKCAPDQTHPQMKTCFTTAPIPPGQCINLSAAVCDMGNGNREIMVNPPAFNGNAQLPECTCQDNWSLWSGPGVSCEPPSCSNTTTTTVRRVNMFLAIDKSGSMNADLGNGDTRWTATIKALKKFVQDPASANLGVALRFWPDDSPVSGCNSTTCSTNACKAPLVNVGLLTLQSAPTDTQEQLLLNALNSKSPGGTTPMSAALAGATQWAIDYKAAHPQEEAIVVLATDGDPNGCNENANTISNYAGTAFTNSGIKTYAIGIQDANPVLMNLIASKGGTNQGFFIAPGANVEYELLAALVQAKGNTISCDFVVPDGGVYDPGAAKITLTPTVGMPIVLNNVGSAAQCGSGWYYDNPAAPTQIKLCPTTCTAVLNDSGTKVEVDLGCPGNYEPVTFTYQYYSDCPQGTKTQWSYFSYETLTPANSNVVWKARTSDTVAGLPAATYTTLATSRSTPTDTQICLMSGPAPCPVNLYTSFGPVDARKSYLELSVTINPAMDKSAAAKVNGWELTYSCPPSE